MSKLNIDTDKIKSAGEDLKTISTELTTLLDEMYGKINGLPTSGIWSSESSKGSVNIFVNNTKNDYTSSIAFSKSINSIGSAVINYAHSLEETADNTL